MVLTSFPLQGFGKLIDSYSFRVKMKILLFGVKAILAVKYYSLLKQNYRVFTHTLFNQLFTHRTWKKYVYTRGGKLMPDA